MDTSGKFVLPSPKFKDMEKPHTITPHFLTPHGMMLPRGKQPPPMYGARGATYPSKYLAQPTAPAANPTPEKSQKYFCEPCEAEFHTSTDYKVHRSEHVQCEIDNCSFRGHPAFMDTHITLQHASGIYDQLKKLNTPEEIAQWRAERKKNYPTVASVEQKWKAREQRMLRGEKLERIKNRFGRQSDRRQMKPSNQPNAEGVKNKPESNRRQKKRKRFELISGRANKATKVEEVKQPAVEGVESEESACGGLTMFKGTAKMAGYKRIKKANTNALSSLVGMYGSDSDSESEDGDHSEEESPFSSQEVNEAKQNSTEEQPVMEEDVTEGPDMMDATIPEQSTSNDVTVELKTRDEASTEESTNIADNTVSGDPQPEVTGSDDEAPEEVPIEKNTSIPDRVQPILPEKKLTDPAPAKKPLRSGLDYKKLRSRRQNTMLEKLLEPEIRHERNVLLQCVRFVVENNFFGIGTSSTSTSST